MPKYAGNKGYSETGAEHGHHLPARGEKETFIKGDGVGGGHVPQIVTPLPEKTVEEAMKMRYIPVRGEKETFVKGESSGHKPKTKTPMKMNSYKGS